MAIGKSSHRLANPNTHGELVQSVSSSVHHFRIDSPCLLWVPSYTGTRFSEVKVSFKKIVYYSFVSQNAENLLSNVVYLICFVIDKMFELSYFSLECRML